MQSSPPPEPTFRRPSLIPQRLSASLRSSLSPQSSPPPAPVPRFVQWAGSLVGRGALAAAIATIPATIRVVSAAPEESALALWIVLTAAAIAPATLAMVVLRRARYGLRAFDGPEASLLALGFAAWVVSSFLVLAVLGAVLRATTHHRPLAGVTFAFMAMLVMGATGLAVRRLVGLARGAGTLPRATIAGLAFASVFLALVTALVGPARAATSQMSASSPQAIVLDLFALVMAASVLAREGLARRRLLARIGLPLAGGMILLGLLLSLRSDSLRAAVRGGAPAFSPSFVFLGGD